MNFDIVEAKKKIGKFGSFFGVQIWLKIAIFWGGSFTKFSISQN
jgi:hypothetical protein